MLATGSCPADYIEWRGYCYRYYQWILRHYTPDEYAFQTTWQSALRHCEEVENGTMLTVYDADEAFFILVRGRPCLLAVTSLMNIYKISATCLQRDSRHLYLSRNLSRSGDIRLRILCMLLPVAHATDAVVLERCCSNYREPQAHFAGTGQQKWRLQVDVRCSTWVNNEYL